MQCNVMDCMYMYYIVLYCMSVSVCRLVYAYVYASALSVVIQRSKIDKKVRRKCRESAEKVLRKCRETDIFAQQTLLFA